MIYVIRKRVLAQCWFLTGTVVRPKKRDFFLSCPLCFFPYSRLSSYRLRLFLYLISFLLFPYASVWENTRARVPNFPFRTFTKNLIHRLLLFLLFVLNLLLLLHIFWVILHIYCSLSVII